MGRFKLVHGAVIASMVAMSISVGVAIHVSASSSSSPSVFVPIVPCRLADTRPGADNVGTRATPIGGPESVTFAVWGGNGNCTIPTTATGIASNVTAVGPTASSYLTVYPADANPRPAASNLNVTAAAPPTPNQVTVALSAAGSIAIYNSSGSVNVIVDIVGYYIPATGGGTQGPPGVQGPPGPSGVTPQNVIWVAKSGGQFTSLSSAMASITDANPHVIMVAPGTYVETAPTVLKNNVDIEGSGEGRTTITCACTLADVAGQRSTIYGSGGLSAEIRNVTITNSGGPAPHSVAVELTSVTATMSIVDTTMTATSNDTTATGLMLTSSELPHIDDINVYVAGAPTNLGVAVYGGGHVVVRNSWLYISGQGASFAGNAGSRLDSSTVNGITVNLIDQCDAVLTVFNTPYTCT
jgi:hypothetical protein